MARMTSWLGNTIPTLKDWGLHSGKVLASCLPPPQPPTHPQFRLNELLPVLWFLSPSYAAAWCALIFQVELPSFHSGLQNEDKESPSKVVLELFSPSLLASVFLMETWFTCHQKKTKTKKNTESAASEVLDKASPLGFYFRGDHSACWEEGFNEKPESRFLPRGWVELFWDPRGSFWAGEHSCAKLCQSWEVLPLWDETFTI